MKQPNAPIKEVIHAATPFKISAAREPSTLVLVAGLFSSVVIKVHFVWVFTKQNLEREWVITFDHLFSKFLSVDSQGVGKSRIQIRRNSPSEEQKKLLALVDQKSEVLKELQSRQASRLSPEELDASWEQIVTHLMGHHSISFTARQYGHWIPEARRKSDIGNKLDHAFCGY